MLEFLLKISTFYILKNICRFHLPLWGGYPVIERLALVKAKKYICRCLITLLQPVSNGDAKTFFSDSGFPVGVDPRVLVEVVQLQIVAPLLARHGATKFGRPAVKVYVKYLLKG